MSDCNVRLEVDEYLCVTCGLRWGRDEDKPSCPRQAQVVGEKPETIYVLEEFTLDGKIVEPGMYEIRRVV